MWKNYETREREKERERRKLLLILFIKNFWNKKGTLLFIHRKFNSRVNIFIFNTKYLYKSCRGVGSLMIITFFDDYRATVCVFTREVLQLSLPFSSDQGKIFVSRVKANRCHSMPGMDYVLARMRANEIFSTYDALDVLSFLLSRGL